MYLLSWFRLIVRCLRVDRWFRQPEQGQQHRHPTDDSGSEEGGEQIDHCKQSGEGRAQNMPKSTGTSHQSEGMGAFLWRADVAGIGPCHANIAASQPIKHARKIDDSQSWRDPKRQAYMSE